MQILPDKMKNKLKLNKHLSNNCRNFHKFLQKIRKYQCDKVLDLEDLFEL